MDIAIPVYIRTDCMGKRIAPISLITFLVHVGRHGEANQNVKHLLLSAQAVGKVLNSL
jgi:hypothetical protein